MKIAVRQARRIATSVIGVTLLAIGAALLVLPGPGVLIFATGLGVLSLEYVWAQSWLSRLRRGISVASRNRRLRLRR